MIASINRIADRNDCREAILLQQRPAWVIAAAATVFVVMMALLPSNLGAIVNGAIAGGCLGLVLALTTTTVLVGRCGEQVIVAKASPWRQGQATELLATLDAPVDANIEGGFLGKKITFHGENYLLQKALEDRFRAVIE